MKEVELPKSVDGKLNIAEVTTFENGILLVYRDNSIIGYIAFNDCEWCFYSSIDITIAQENNSSLYVLVNNLINGYIITNIKLLEFNQK